MYVRARGKGNFIKLDKALLCAQYFLSTKGEYIPLTTNDKIIYVYIKDRVDHFNNNFDPPSFFYESQSEIARSCNVSRGTVVNSVNKFIEAGVLITHKTKVFGWDSVVYDKMLDLDLYVKGDEGREIKNTNIKESPF